MAVCEQCKADYEAKRADSKYCSGACRAKAKRTRTPDELSARAKRTQPDVKAGTRIGPDVQYQPRTHPERINWGEYMTRAELDAAGLKANRVSIPGDWDYQGVAA